MRPLLLCLGILAGAIAGASGYHYGTSAVDPVPVRVPSVFDPYLYEPPALVPPGYAHAPEDPIRANDLRAAVDTLSAVLATLSGTPAACAAFRILDEAEHAVDMAGAGDVAGHWSWATMNAKRAIFEGWTAETWPYCPFGPLGSHHPWPPFSYGVDNPLLAWLEGYDAGL